MSSLLILHGLLRVTNSSEHMIMSCIAYRKMFITYQLFSNNVIQKSTSALSQNSEI
uniref:Uncharacterized protein n=1 Tax=Arundo donax TaxID=35708 RepID=A0A0A9FUH9_ARUDO